MPKKKKKTKDQLRMESLGWQWIACPKCGKDTWKHKERDVTLCGQCKFLEFVEQM